MMWIYFNSHAFAVIMISPCVSVCPLSLSLSQESSKVGKSWHLVMNSDVLAVQMA